MRIAADRRARVVAIAATVILVMVGTVLAVWAPRASRPDGAVVISPSPRPPPEQPRPSAEAIPALISLPHPDAWEPLQPCDPTLTPRRSGPVEAGQPISGPVDLEVVGRLGGLVSAATLRSDALYAGTGSQVAQVDISDPAHPREVATSDPLPGQVEDIRAVGEILAVAVGAGGLAILDRQRLQLRSALALPGYAEALAVEGRYAYVADGPGGLRVVDLADPERPMQIGVVLDLHLVLGVAVAGGRAYLAAADEGLVVVDVGDPAAPVEVGRLFTGGYAFGVALAGERVLLADGWGGLRVVDASDPRAPRLVSSVPTAGWTLAVRADGGRAYIAEGSGMRILDLATPDLRPMPLQEFSAYADNKAAYATAVDVVGERAVIVDDTVGIRILDVRKDGLEERGTYAPVGPPVAPFSGLAVSGDRVYLAAGSQGARIVDVSDPRQPTEVARIGTEHSAVIASAVGANVFVGTGYPAVIGLDTRAPELRPQVRQTAERLYVNVAGIATAVDGSLLFTAAESGLLILDGSSAVPCELGFLDAFALGFESFSAVGVAGELAYMGGDMFWIVDVSDPRAPVLLGTAELGRTIEGEALYRLGGMAVVGQTLYAIADTAVGWAVAVYDLTTPMEPRLQGMARLPVMPPPTSFLRGPVYGGGLLWVADGAAGLVAVDVSDPTRPALAGRLRLPGDVMGVAVHGDHAYVISPGGGFFVVEWSARPTARSDDNGPDGVPAVRTVQVPAQPAAIALTQATSQCQVTSTGDSGPGSLRDCLAIARSGTEIRFAPRAFPPDGPATIRLASPLPPLPDNVTIDASGAGVVLDGAGLPGPDEDPWASNDRQGGDHGLRVGSGSVVRGLTITGFSGSGIFIQGGGNTVADNVVSANRTNGIVLAGGDDRVVGNLIGLDPSGARAWGAQRQGIWIAGSDRNVIGGPEPADRNVISGNQMDIVINGSNNTVQGNYLGTDATGSVKIRKDFEGLPGESLSGAITFDCCSKEGGGTTGNRIVGNVVAWGGISMVGPTTWFNEVVGNFLGLDATGTRWLGGSDHGPPIVGIGPARFNRIGGSVPGEANVGDFSIIVSDHVVVLGNQLGVDARGSPLRTPYSGTGAIVVDPGARATIGGRSPQARNLVVGDGITIRAHSTLVVGNLIRATTVAFGVPEEVPIGIRIEAGAGSQLIANVVEAVAGMGIQLGTAASATAVRGNVLRDSAIGLVAEAGSGTSLVAGNRFEDNGIQARDEGVANAWDDGRRGNWWSDLRGVDADGDGILDRAREVTPAGVDRYPLAQPP